MTNLEHGHVPRLESAVAGCQEGVDVRIVHDGRHLATDDLRGLAGNKGVLLNTIFQDFIAKMAK